MRGRWERGVPWDAGVGGRVLSRLAGIGRLQAGEAGEPAGAGRL